MLAQHTGSLACSQTRGTLERIFSSLSSCLVNQFLTCGTLQRAILLLAAVHFLWCKHD
jgi:hypothetical protein